MKRSIDKHTLKTIQELREQSLTEQEIVDQLSVVYLSKEGLIRLLIVTATESKKMKYKKTIMVLLGLFALNFILDLYLMLFVIEFDHDVAAFYVFKLLISAVSNLVFPIMIYQFKPSFFILAPLFSLNGLLQLYLDTDNYTNYPISFILMKILLAAALLVFSVSLLRKIFPNYLRTFGMTDLSRFDFIEP